MIVLPRGRYPSEAAEVLRWAADSSHPIAFDIETVGLDFNDPTNRLRTVQLGDHERAYVLWPEQRAVIAQALRSLQRPLAHNGLFDALWINQRLRIPMLDVMARTIDTQTLGHLYDPRKTYNLGDEVEEESAWEAPSGLGLKELAVRFLGPESDEPRRRLYEAHSIPASSGKLFDAAWAAIPDDDPLLLDYAATDVILTARLFAELWARLSDHERNELEPVERAVTWHAYRICERGMLVDTDAAAAVREVLLDERRHLDTELGLNADSPKQVRQALLDDGAQLTKLTAKKELSVDRKVLEGLGTPLAERIRAARQSKKYATAYADKLARSGGVVHPFVRVTGTATGRWSIADPPIQQWPKFPLQTSTSAVSMRSLFHAEPGKLLVSCDLSSIEVVVAAAVTEDKNLLAAVEGKLSDKLRIYDDLAAELDVERKVAKTIVLGGQYGAGSEKLAVILGTSDFNRVKKLKARTFGGYWCSDKSCQRPSADRDACADHLVWDDGFYPGPRTFRRTVERSWGEGWNGELREAWPGLRNPYGRWVPARADPRSRQLIRPDWFPIFNHVVQGSSRDLLMRMLLDVHAAGLDPWLTVHDEIVVQVDEADAVDAQLQLQDLMQYVEHPLLGVPIRAESSPGSFRWSGEEPIS